MMCRAFLALGALVALATAARAEDAAPSATVVSATIGLRGGFDQNPTDSSEARGSAFETQTLSFDYVHGTAKEGYSVNLTSVNTFYDPRVAAPSLSNNLTFNNGLDLGGGVSLRTTLQALNDTSWSRRQETALLRNRVEYDQPSYRLFMNLDTSINSLNERNIFALGNFLPRPENYVNVTVLPGAAYKLPFGEVGASFSATDMVYLEDFDYIGLRRDETRLQPNLFANATYKDIAVEGSISPFRAIFPAKDFDTVKKLLYTAKLKVPWKMFTLDLSSTRTVQDTTLPFSAIDVVTQHEARLTAKINDANAVSAYYRWKQDDYRGLGAIELVKTIGVDYAHKLGNGFVATTSVSTRKVQETGSVIPRAFNVTLGLQKQLDFSPSNDKSATKTDDKYPTKTADAAPPAKLH